MNNKEINRIIDNNAKKVLKIVKQSQENKLKKKEQINNDANN